MFDTFSIKNFKALGETQHIPVKPITLIFGPNSAGKSSLIHSLLYARETLESNSFDVVHTKIGGSAVDLGGFQQFVFRRDESLGVELTFEIKHGNIDGLEDQISNLFSTTTIKISVGFSEESSEKKVKLKFYEFFIDGEVLIRLRPENDRKFTIDLFNYEHSIIEKINSNYLFTVDKSDKIYDRYIKNIEFNNNGLFNTNMVIDKLYSEFFNNTNELNKTEIREYHCVIDIIEHIKIILNEVENNLKTSLKNFQYLGPLRPFPPRHLAFLDNREPNWLGGGLNAWYKVLRNKQIREHINDWIEDNCLETKYRLDVHNYIPKESLRSPVLKSIEVINSDGTFFELENDIDMVNTVLESEKATTKIIDTIETANLDFFQELLLTDLRTNTIVSHRDIGVGMSQILPILVSIYGSEKELIAIEQPELHLHPALQAKIGDAFINSALGENRNTFLLETHSEHLILRILRRIRQTKAGELPTDVLPIKPDDVSVLYLNPTSNGTLVTEIPITEEGDFEVAWPKGFFEERIEEYFGP